MSLATMVQALSDIAAELEAEYDSGVDDELPTAEKLGVVLCALRDCRADLAVLAKKVEGGFLSMAGERYIVVDGYGEFQAQKKTKRTKWQWDTLVPAVISRVMDEPGTIYDDDGTLLPYATIGHNVAAKLHDCIGFSAGKVTGLRAIGLQSDEFCTETPDGWSVKLPKRAADVQTGDDDADS